MINKIAEEKNEMKGTNNLSEGASREWTREEKEPEDDLGKSFRIEMKYWKIMWISNIERFQIQYVSGKWESMNRGYWVCDGCI